jgi:tRNA threonylcarbamoyladenosine biosynthesis protein TsaB
MLLLAVDTSGKNGSLALARAAPGQNAREVDVLEVVSLTGGAFSAQLVPQIAASLEKYGHCKSDIDAFAVAIGPGSFTGLRVGLAAIKALAEVLQKPIAAVSVLEAVGWHSRAPGATRVPTLALLDAGRGDVYVGNYELDPQICVRSERLLTGEAFLAEIATPEVSPRNIITPNAALADKVRDAGIRVELAEYPDAGTIARLGWEHLERGETVQPETLEANYIRHSDTEIFSKAAR